MSEEIEAGLRVGVWLRLSRINAGWADAVSDVEMYRTASIERPHGNA